MEPASRRSPWQRILQILELDEATLSRRRRLSGSSQMEIIPTEPVSPELIELRRANRLRSALIFIIFLNSIRLWRLVTGIFIIYIIVYVWLH